VRGAAVNVPAGGAASRGGDHVPAYYLRRELRRRLRQTIFVSLGLAVGIGLAITVTAVSGGVRGGQDTALANLYGVGTEHHRHRGRRRPRRPNRRRTAAAEAASGHPQARGVDPRCFLVGYSTQESMSGNELGRLGPTAITRISQLPGVAAAAGGLTATDLRVRVTIPQGGGGFGSWTERRRRSRSAVSTSASPGSARSPPGSSPLAGLTASEVDAAGAVVDAGLATQQQLTVGSTVTVAGKRFDVAGIVSQPPGATPASVYIPLAQAQARMADDVNTIYVAAERASDVAAVRAEISGLLPSANLTSSDNLAGRMSGSLSTAARLADDLGRWLAIMVLVAAFALACLLTLSAVSRRATELGLLKALGWQSAGWSGR
jgi:putative ABC transport system permease protein